MNDLVLWPGLIVAGVAGLVLGAVFFGGLFWTVRRAVSSPRPGLWFVGSLLVRMGLVVAGFFLIGGGHGSRLLGCLLGFMLARLLVMRLTRAPAPLSPVAPVAHSDSSASNSDAKGARHAS